MNIQSLTDISYVGKAGISKNCVDAIIRLLHYGDNITEAKLLTCNNEHCFIIVLNEFDIYAIRSGFSSGYSGGGPKALSYVIELLLDQVNYIDEYIVKKSFFNKINNSCLTFKDIKWLEDTTPEPTKSLQYILKDTGNNADNNSRIYSKFPKTLPLGIIDSRLIDCAHKFIENPDNAIMSGYRKLEDIIREKSGFNEEHSTKLFSKAFESEDSPLTWDKTGPCEIQGRILLFKGAFMAFRNIRAHRQQQKTTQKEIQEFLLLNQLFLLEKESVKRTPS